MKTVTFDESVWQLVPVEPTEAMISEVIDAGSFDEDDVTYFWDSMLAAAPKPKDE